MPHYTFVDTETDEEFNEILSIKDRNEFLEKNPHMKQKLTAPQIGDSVRLGVTKPKIEHRELLDNMHKKLGAPGVDTTTRQTY